MSSLFALALGVLFGLAVYALRHGNAIRIVVGLAVLANTVNLLLISAGFRGDAAPIHPFEAAPADPLVQALVLTAIVIGFGVTAFALVLAYSLIEAEDTTNAEDFRRLKG